MYNMVYNIRESLILTCGVRNKVDPIVAILNRQLRKMNDLTG